MISTESRIVIRLRRRNTPAVPIENRTPERIRYWFSVTTSAFPSRTARDHDRPADRHEDQNRRHFEGEGVRGVERAADPRHAADRRDRARIVAERLVADPH